MTYHTTQTNQWAPKPLNTHIQCRNAGDIIHETGLGSLKTNGGFRVPGLLILPLVVNLSLENSDFTVHKCTPGVLEANGDLRWRPLGPSFHQHEVKIDCCLIILVQKTVCTGVCWSNGEGIGLRITKERFRCPAASLSVRLSFPPPTLPGGHRDTWRLCFSTAHTHFPSL